MAEQDLARTVVSKQRTLQIEGLESFTRIDIALLALLRAGGAEHMVDLEDIAVEAHRIMPEMFRWRRYGNLPSYDATRVALSDAKKEKVGEPLVLYGTGHLRMLTAAGVEWARAVQVLIDRGVVTSGDVAARRPVTRELTRIERHPAYLRYRRSGLSSVDRVDLGDLLLCPTGAPANVFANRLRQLETMAVEWDRPAIRHFLRDCIDGLTSILTRETSS